jgi:pyrophosphate--fructose-6-phosphate 1-phosphotransferase
MQEQTPLQLARKEYIPKIPKSLEDILTLGSIKEYPKKQLPKDIESLFPLTSHFSPLTFVNYTPLVQNQLKIGVLFSGGQAPGGHNVIIALFDALKKSNCQSELYGFLGGPSGLVNNKNVLLTNEKVDPFRNQGGFDLIGSGRTKIETDEQLSSSMKTCQDLKLDGLVIIGGDDSNTNAAILAEHFLAHGCKTSIVGVPKTIDGDLRSQDIEISFGFDTATKVYSELIGNILRDALSAKKYYHFIKLMGRSASHITLECALQCQPNYAIILEEVVEKKKTLDAIVQDIADLIVKRAESKKNYGCILIPEGLIEFIPEVKLLIKELNTKFAINPQDVLKNLSKEALSLFESLPKNIQEQLLKDRDPHGNVQVAHIETEKLLIEKVSLELKKRKESGSYKGSFNALSHYLGYEGRSALPTNFDCNYCYSLGLLAFLVVAHKLTGYIVYVKNLACPVEDWLIGALPLVSLMTQEERKGKMTSVIKKALVDLEGPCFKSLKNIENELKLNDHYLMRGPIQFFGPVHLTDSPPKVLSIS